MAAAGLCSAERVFGAIQCQAESLVANFREGREELQTEIQKDLDARRLLGTRRQSLYCPLSLFVRSTRGTLELYWQEVHINRQTRRPVYKYLRRNSNGETDMRILMARARFFEKSLVRATELEARRIRKYWRLWVKFKLSCEVAWRFSQRHPE